MCVRPKNTRTWVVNSIIIRKRDIPVRRGRTNERNEAKSSKMKRNESEMNHLCFIIHSYNII